MPSATSARTPSITGTAPASTSAASPDPTRSSREVAEQPEAGDVGRRVRARRRSRAAASRASAFSVVMTRTASATSARCGRAALHRGGDHPEPDRLGEHQHVAGPRAAVGEHPRRIDRADDREPELRLGVVDRVTAADERHPASRSTSSPPSSTARAARTGSALARPGDEVEREQRRATHRVDVGERVRGRDASPVVGVVDDRREEVGGDDDGEVVAQPVDRGVVGGVEADEQVGIVGAPPSPRARARGRCADRPGESLHAQPAPCENSVNRTGVIRAPYACLRRRRLGGDGIGGGSAGADGADDAGPDRRDLDHGARVRRMEHAAVPT